MKQSFDVTGMTCAACSARVEKAASSVPGVESVAVNLLKNTMEVTYVQPNGTERTRTVLDPDSFTYVLDESGN